jgi:hypothetical protein
MTAFEISGDPYDEIERLRADRDRLLEAARGVIELGFLVYDQTAASAINAMKAAIAAAEEPKK